MVVQCLTHMVQAVQSIAQFSSTPVLVFDQDDAEEKLRGLNKFPGAVVQYEGMRSTGNPSNSGSNSAILVASILVINTGEKLIRTDTKVPTIKLLTELRGALLHQKAPNGHFWQFLVEAAASTKGNLSFWVQRWQVPIQFQARR
jgi:hypothetical protein